MGTVEVERPGVKPRRPAVWRSQDLTLGPWDNPGWHRAGSDRVKPGGQRRWGGVGTHCWNPGEVTAAHGPRLLPPQKH